jgi:zinc/manganese transport system ATP-binding protein
MTTKTTPAVTLDHASLALGGRRLWQDLSLEIKPGEFLAILGPNGSGKTSLLRVLLGLYPLESGTVLVNGEAPKRGSNAIGYVPQQKSFDPDLPIRGRDLVHFGLDGHRYGFGLHSSDQSTRVNEVIDEVGATAYADAPVGLLSGGEQQRLRIAQALLGDPQVLLCDEPLLSLDLSHQQGVSALIDERRKVENTAVIFVTHDINPILPMVDRVLYLVGKRWAIGTPDEVLTTEKLSELYSTPIEVIRIHNRIIVIGGETELTEPGTHHHEHTHHGELT